MVHHMAIVLVHQMAIVFVGHELRRWPLPGTGQSLEHPRLLAPLGLCPAKGRKGPRDPTLAPVGQSLPALCGPEVEKLALTTAVVRWIAVNVSAVRGE